MSFVGRGSVLAATGLLLVISACGDTRVADPPGTAAVPASTRAVEPSSDSANSYPKPDFSRPFLIDAKTTTTAAAEIQFRTIDSSQQLARPDAWGVAITEVYATEGGLDFLLDSLGIQVLITPSEGAGQLDAADLAYADAKRFGATVEDVALKPEIAALRISGPSADSLLFDTGKVRVNIVGPPGTYDSIRSIAARIAQAGSPSYLPLKK